MAVWRASVTQADTSSTFQAQRTIPACALRTRSTQQPNCRRCSAPKGHPCWTCLPHQSQATGDQTIPSSVTSENTCSGRGLGCCTIRRHRCKDTSQSYDFTHSLRAQNWWHACSHLWPTVTDYLKLPYAACLSLGFGEQAFVLLPHRL